MSATYAKLRDGSWGIRGSGLTVLTRTDEVGDGVYDSIAWAFAVHIGRPDDPRVVVAVLHGNEDAPSRIDMYYVDRYDRPPDIVWP